MTDILGRHLRLLVVCRQAEPKRLNRAELADKTGLDWKSLTPCINDLEALGLLAVEEGRDGPRKVFYHGLTREGQAVADQAVKTEALVPGAKKRANERA